MLLQKFLVFSHRKNILSLTLIGLIAFFIRIYYFPFELPVVNDALLYFYYAADVSYLGYLPNDWTPANNGWPAFLGIFFHILPQEHGMITYMHIQRLASIFLSTVTIIPAYFLCKRFFKPELAIVGAALFVLDPRIIQNSIFGIAEPLYFLIGVSSLALILSSDKRLIYSSFILVALATLVRGEGLFLFITISSIFLIKNRKDMKEVLKYPIFIIVFLLIILPLSIYRTEINGGDGIFDRVAFSVSDGSLRLTESESGDTPNKIFSTIELYIKYIGWILIPNFILFVPIGIILTLKQRNFQTVFIAITSFVMSLPAIAAYFVPYLETRYLYILLPIFSLLALLTIKEFTDKKQNQNIILLIIIIGIIIASLSFLEFKKIDIQHERDAYEVAQYISNLVKGVNRYYPESEYLGVATIFDWPFLSTSLNEIKIISTSEYDSLGEFIENSRSLGLTHLVIDDNKGRSSYLKAIYTNERSYPYLHKVFDSATIGLNYHVKVFEINYEEYYCIIKHICSEKN